jgi:hypothetical protein
MKIKDLTTSEDRTERIFFALLCLSLLVAMMLISCIASAQEPIKLTAKTHAFKEVPTFRNKQGFYLPVTVSDTTNVYQIGDKGTPFYFRQSKKTGLIYKVYIKKDSVKTSNK